ncbi:MAG: hypothetical protein IT385_04150 [Deltaproteobacteria bacterium]|nr:hypothetical protein [Deltaproteobacteria bacterium]
MAEAAAPSPNDASPADKPGQDEARGLSQATIDPFALWLTFAKSRRAGKVRTAFVSFLERWKEPIDVQVDKRLDLQAFGKGPHQFLKAPRNKRPDELNSDIAERMKTDVERQFNLRNLGRYVKTVNKGDPLEFKRKPVEVGKLDVDARAHMSEVYKRIEGIVIELGTAAVRAELAWRHRMLEVMQWERYFSKEIREEFSGPMWRHDPDTNPVGAQGRQTADQVSADAPARATIADAVVAAAPDEPAPPDSPAPPAPPEGPAA